MSLQKCTVIYDGKPLIGPADMPLIPFLEHCNVKLPHVCYHPALDPLQTCDVCWVESEGELVRGCTLRSREGMVINSANEPPARRAKRGWIGYWQNMNSTAPSASTTPATARCITP